MQTVISGPVCTNCGVAYPPGMPAPAFCPICEDERVTAPGLQTWTTMAALTAGHRCEIQPCEPGLSSIAVIPSFAIGQRAMLVEQGDGCILWDCLSMVDANAVEYVNARGGLKAIAISHPHFYGAAAEWSAAFGNAPVYVHANDKDWMQLAPRAVVYWTGDTLEIAPGVTLIRCGGHFEGGAVLHVAEAAGGHGALLTGDVIMVTQYGSGVSFMRSYPTYVPLHAEQVRHLRSVVEPFAFEALYGAWPDRVIATGGSEVVARTALRHLEVLSS